MTNTSTANTSVSITIALHSVRRFIGFWCCISAFSFPCHG